MFHALFGELRIGFLKKKKKKNYKYDIAEIINHQSLFYSA